MRLAPRIVLGAAWCRTAVDALAEALLARETLDEREIFEVTGPGPTEAGAHRAAVVMPRAGTRPA